MVVCLRTTPGSKSFFFWKFSLFVRNKTFSFLNDNRFHKIQNTKKFFLTSSLVRNTSTGYISHYYCISFSGYNFSLPPFTPSFSPRKKRNPCKKKNFFFLPPRRLLRIFDSCEKKFFFVQCFSSFETRVYGLVFVVIIVRSPPFPQV